MLDEMPPAEVVAEIAAKVSQEKLEKVLMQEGEAKFADPQKSLLALLEEKREAFMAG